MTYGFEIRWGRKTYSVSWCATREEAVTECVRWARSEGWTRPRWWQFWRAGDNDIPKDLRHLFEPKP